MASNAQSFADLYLGSTTQYIEKDLSEAKESLVKQQKSNDAYLKYLMDTKKSLDDDIRSWVDLGGKVDRDERKLLLSQMKFQHQRKKDARRGVRSASSVITKTYSKVEEKAAKATAGAGAESGLTLATVLEGASKTKNTKAQADAIAEQLLGDSSFTNALQSGAGYGRKAGKEGAEAGEKGRLLSDGRHAFSMGMRRALVEANRFGVPEQAINMAISKITGTPDRMLNDKVYDAAKRNKARTVSSKASAPGVKIGNILTDQLLKDGFALDDFMPMLEAQNMMAQRADLQAKIAQAEAKRVGNIDAEAERILAEGVDRGRGVPFAGRGLLGAIQYGGQVKDQMAETASFVADTDAYISEQKTIDDELAAMSPNMRLLRRATGYGLSSFEKHGLNKPPGISEDLWSVGGQIAQMAKSGGFNDYEDLVVKARAMVNQLPNAAKVGNAQRENMLMEALEFYTMQKQGEFPVVEEAVVTVEEEQGTPSDRKTRRKRAKEADKKKVEPPVVVEDAKPMTKQEKTKHRATLFGLDKNQQEVLRRISSGKYGDLINLGYSAYEGKYGKDQVADVQSEIDALYDKNKASLKKLEMLDPSAAAKLAKKVPKASKLPDAIKFGYGKDPTFKAKQQLATLAYQRMLFDIIENQYSDADLATMTKATGKKTVGGRPVMNISDLSINLNKYLAEKPELLMDFKNLQGQKLRAQAGVKMKLTEGFSGVPGGIKKLSKELSEAARVKEGWLSEESLLLTPPSDLEPTDGFPFLQSDEELIGEKLANILEAEGVAESLTNIGEAEEEKRQDAEEQLGYK